MSEAEYSAMVRDPDPVRRQLRVAKVWLDICRGRMERCEGTHPDTHPVSLREIPNWMAAIDETIRRSLGEV